MHSANCTHVSTKNDVDERNQQVQLMGDIYSSASRTLIWVGEETEEVAKAFATIVAAVTYFPLTLARA